MNNNVLVVGDQQVDLDGSAGGINVTGQVSASSFIGNGSGLTGIIAAGSVSGSSQVVLESADKTGFTGASSITTLGTVTSGNVTAILPSGTISSSAQLADDFIDTLGDGVHSGSAQVVAALVNQDVNFGTGDITGVTHISASGAISSSTLSIGSPTSTNNAIAIFGSGNVDGAGAVVGITGDGTAKSLIQVRDNDGSNVLAITGSVADDNLIVQFGDIDESNNGTFFKVDDSASKMLALANSFQVGTNTQYGSAKLSVAGAISSSGTITGTTINGSGAGLTNIPNSALSNSSVTVTAGNGLSGGGAVSLGGTVSVAVQVDDSSLEIDSDTVRVKASGITNAMLGGSIANDKLANDGITIAGNDISLGGTITAATILAGSGVLSGSANADTATSSSFASNAASADAVADNSVVLGTSTTGDYIASLGSGTGVTIGSNSGEGSNPTIAVNYGSNANQAVQGNTTATFTGTANEITVSDSSAQALGGGISVQIGLPDDVTIAGTGSVNGDLSVAGNLSVGGDLTYINSTDLMVTDPFILLNSGSNGATQGDSGIIFGGADDVVNSGNLLFWDKDYNGNDGRLSIKNGFAHTTTGNPTADYRIAGVFEGSAANAETAQADHVGNIRVESDEIYIYV